MTPFSPPARRAAAVAVAALAAWAWLAPAARADNLDKQLMKHGDQILDYLQRRNCRNVGVLKFRVQKGNSPATFAAGPLNSGMARRLTHLLIYKVDPNKPIQVIWDANQPALARRLPVYTRPEGLRGLFNLSYPVTWGKGSVKADTFLTGLVQVDRDMRRGKVLIQAYRSGLPKPERVAEVRFKTDRSFLAALGQSYVVPRSRLVRLDTEALGDGSDGGSVCNADLAAADSACKLDQSGQNPLKDPNNLLQLRVFYNDVEQNLIAGSADGGEPRIPEPTETDRVHIAIRNLDGAKTIGVVLLVNGKSTLFDEQGEPQNCKRWILGPGEEYLIYGHHNEDRKTYRPFKVLSEAESAAVEYSEHLGLIQAHVLLSGEVPVTAPSIDITRGAKHRSRDLKTLKQQLARAFTRRGILVPDPEAPPQPGELIEVDFPNPQPQGSVTVRYYQR